MDARRLARVALGGVVAALVLAPGAAAAPSGTVSVAPAPPDRPNIGEVVTFTAENVNWDGTPGTIVWIFGDGGSESGPSVAHSYSAQGAKEVHMILTNGESQVTVVGPVIVQVNAPPVAVFNGFAPESPLPGQTVQFASDSFDPDGTASHLWDFGDGTPSSSLRNPTHAYALPGIKSVTLTVVDGFASDTETRQLLVATPLFFPNAAPHVGFAFSPRSPKVGDLVEFASSAIDPEGALREQRWDLDGDGQFDDAQGEQVLHTFSTPGAKTVRLRVEDAAGGAAVRERNVPVGAGRVAGAGFLNPFPVVRITGEVRRRGAKIRILSVRAPRGAKVRLRCRGKGCPVKGARRTVRRAGSVRFKAFERMLRAGVKLEIFVRKPGTIGKYTRFTIRAGASPKRVDRCLPPRTKRPVRCPRSAPSSNLHSPRK